MCRSIYVAKTKALISFAVTAKLICVFVFAYAKRWFSHDVAQLYLYTQSLLSGFGVKVSVTFHLTGVHVLVRFWLLSGHLLGNSCSLG